MSKFERMISVCAVIALVPALAYAQAAREATIEPETKTKVVLQSRLSSKLSEVGDPVSVVVDEPIYVDGQLVIPRGTEFHGRVTQVSRAKRGQKAATITIAIERLAMPWGEEPVSVVLMAIDDWDKNEKLKANDEGKVSGGHRGGATADNVLTGGGIGGGAAGVILLSGGPAGAGAAALGGGLLAGLFLTKGGEVQVNPGAIFRVKFVKPITLPVIAQPGSSPRPIQQDSTKPPVQQDPTRPPL
ncbi:MAG: hypothetical protein WAU45_01400 [Blastocatellia bacterium]